MGINLFVSYLQIFLIFDEKARSRVIKITFRIVKAHKEARKGQKFNLKIL